MSKRFKISTPHADEYREVIFEVHCGMVVGSTTAGFEHFHGKKWEDVDRNFWSVWKLWSTPCKDNVYPKTEELSPVSKLSHTKESLIAFESKVEKSWSEGNLPCLLHLAGGEEEILLKIFEEVNEGDWVFGSHRSHYLALLSGIPEEDVWNAIHRGDSMFIYSKERNFYVSAILAGCCGIAVGVAVANKAAQNGKWCHVFLGDGAEEEGAFYESVLYSVGHDLPIVFHILDNDQQVETNKMTRRGMDYGLLDSWKCVRRYCYSATYPHAGSHTKGITFKDTTSHWATIIPKLK